MANIDRNFLARPDFVVSTGENGQTVTLTVAPKKTSVGGFQEEVWNITGWTDINFQDLDLNLIQFFGAYGISSINPECKENYSIMLAAEASETVAKQFAAINNFYNFIRQNPVHISRINLRTGNEAVLPQQIVVQYPDIFSGQCTQKIIDVASKKTAYQYQDGVITMDDADVILTRNCNIKFNCSFSVYDSDQSVGVQNPENQLFIDLTIDKYLSLEKALVENLKIM